MTSTTNQWPLITADEACARMSRGAGGLDVRSEGEFARGALPNFTNVPILDDDARHRVGSTYKLVGQAAAIALGHELVDPIRPTLVHAWRSALGDHDPTARLLVCWRGGLRSGKAAEWLADADVAGTRVAGGYKAVRNVLLNTLAKPPPTLTLAGPTGVGKTDVLREIPGALDLERLANHRGSAFGRSMDGDQPAQATFENAVAFALYQNGSRSGAGEVLVEDEGMLIGRLLVPPPVRARIVQSPLVVLDVTLEDRVARTFEEYVNEPVRRFGSVRTHAHLTNGLNAVERKLGGLRTRELRDSLNDAFVGVGEPGGDVTPMLSAHAEWITRLLVEYYDPSYAYGERRHPRTILFRGPRAAVTEFLRDRYRTTSTYI